MWSVDDRFMVLFLIIMIHGGWVEPCMWYI